ncbi:hypothetical protein [Paenibacillus foliorum]|uniref:hypothetical protein n=1 Tax=Paenibacillus foliorum TaxID=2654974 RepID=UPI001490E6A2|nr:hypothetical protein [Paenibacillus foliorum]
MSNVDNFKKFLEGNAEIVEVQVEYLNGDKKDYSLDDSREEAIESLLTDVDWEQVDEIELEYSNGSKTEYSLSEEVEYGEEEDGEEEDGEEEEEEEEEN